MSPMLDAAENKAVLAPEIRGWCPGAYTPMASNDGLLIRPKIIGSRLTAAQAREISSIAADCGNGEIDLSQRAQLQIRGVSEATLADALLRLDAIGLLAANAEAERITNIVAAPLAGLTGAPIDANALAAALATALQKDAALRALPAKFLFVVDDASGLPLGDVAADIRIESTDDDRIALRIAGAPAVSAMVAAADAVYTALGLARAFLTLRGDNTFEMRRMSAIVKAHGADAVFQNAAAPTQPCTPASTPRGVIHGAQIVNGARFVGVATPFGRWRARDLAAAAEFAANEGVGELRLTPWRAMLIPTQSAQAAAQIALLARARGFITSSDDLRLAVVACPGAPECPQAHGATRNTLSRVAALAQHLAGADGVGLHISGCEKGCARSQTTPVTLLVSTQGYDIIDNGRASDPPCAHAPTIEAVVLALAARAAEKSA